MPNMSYCRFENTYPDLKDCYQAMFDDLEGSEFRYRARLIDLCKNIVDAYGDVEFVEQTEDEKDD
jgi:uncharacterized protein with ParB-like and HNH nuclease domain